MMVTISILLCFVISGESVIQKHVGEKKGIINRIQCVRGGQYIFLSTFAQPENHLNHADYGITWTLASAKSCTTSMPWFAHMLHLVCKPPMDHWSMILRYFMKFYKLINWEKIKIT